LNCTDKTSQQHRNKQSRGRSGGFFMIFSIREAMLKKTIEETIRQVIREELRSSWERSE